MTDRYYPGRSVATFPPQETETVSEVERVMITVSSEELASLQYPIVVEGWDKCVGFHAHGKSRRQWLENFTPKERKKAGRLHAKFYEWHLRTGPPQTAIMNIETVLFINKLVDFFAQV